MKKALIFLSAFVVSFVIIYSIYYYSRPAQLRYLEKGFTARADTLKHTLMRPHPYEPSTSKNLIYSSGLSAALYNAAIPVSAANFKEDSNIINSILLTTYAGVFNDAALSQMNLELKREFSNHPPLELKKINKGEDLLFSYIYRNAYFPDGFQESGKGMSFGGKNVKAIMYKTEQDEDDNKNKVQFFVSQDKRSYVLTISLDNNEEAGWVFAPDMQQVANAFKKGQEIIQEANRQKNEEIQVLMPVLDFYLVKDYTNQELAKYFSPEKNNFSLIQERLKMKTSAERVKNLFSREDKSIKKSSYNFGTHSFFYLKRKEAAFPYFGIVLNNADLLIPQP